MLVPKHLERSTYIIFAIIALALLQWQWRPIPDVIWNVEDPTLRLILQWISFAGWLTVLWATILVGHWKIFGVDQVIDFIAGSGIHQGRTQYARILQGRLANHPEGPLEFCPPPRLFRLHRGVLGDADDDGRPSRLRGRSDDLHHDRNLFPRAKPDRPVGGGVCRIRPNPFEDHSVVRKAALTAAVQSGRRTDLKAAPTSMPASDRPPGKPATSRIGRRSRSAAAAMLMSACQRLAL